MPVPCEVWNHDQCKRSFFSCRLLITTPKVSVASLSWHLKLRYTSILCLKFQILHAEMSLRNVVFHYEKSSFKTYILMAGSRFLTTNMRIQWASSWHCSDTIYKLVVCSFLGFFTQNTDLWRLLPFNVYFIFMPTKRFLS